MRPVEWQEVTYGDLAPTVADIVAELEGSWTELKTARFAMSVDDDITRMFGLQAFQGNSFSLVWGVSLSFVPHVWKPALRWHRTVKSARRDLFEVAGDARLPPDRSQLFERLEHSPRTSEELLRRSWGLLRNDVLRWFDHTATVGGVLQTAREQRGRPSGSVGIHWPRAALVEVLCHARLGDAVGARQLASEHRTALALDDSEYELLDIAIVRAAS